MNSSQIHLALTHVPVILSIIGLAILVIAMIVKNDTLTKTSFYLLLVAGISAIPVFFTGEGAEETVERLPGVSESIIERHEDLAKFAFGIVSATAIVALAGLLLYKSGKVLRLIKPLVFVLSLATASLMIVTAHLGGQVRHTEIRTGFTNQTEKGANGDLQSKGNEDND
jgi:uncharacterized membrane protein